MNIEIQDQSNTVPNRISVNADELLSYNRIDLSAVKARDFSHYSFRYYTSMKTLKAIVCPEDGESYFFASNLNGMNDIDEAEAHPDDKEKIHALCFCNTETEGIPMWYMYSGILGKGGCIRFTPKNMIDFLSSVKVVYPVINGKPSRKRPLYVGTDVTVHFGRVYYKDNGNDLFFRNKWYHVADDKDRFFKDNYFVKKYPWNYESEFRIVLKNNTDKVFEKIAIPLPESVIGKCEVLLGPEIKKSEAELDLSENRIKESDLKVKMGLCERNKDDIIEYMKVLKPKRKGKDA